MRQLLVGSTCYFPSKRERHMRTAITCQCERQWFDSAKEGVKGATPSFRKWWKPLIGWVVLVASDCQRQPEGI
jgi:hypothetical protein